VTLQEVGDQLKGVANRYPKSFERRAAVPTLQAARDFAAAAVKHEPSAWEAFRAGPALASARRAVDLARADADRLIARLKGSTTVIQAGKSPEHAEILRVITKPYIEAAALPGIDDTLRAATRSLPEILETAVRQAPATIKAAATATVDTVREAGKALDLPSPGSLMTKLAIGLGVGVVVVGGVALATRKGLL
jgi:hypothetical protein